MYTDRKQTSVCQELRGKSMWQGAVQESLGDGTVLYSVTWIHRNQTHGTVHTQRVNFHGYSLQKRFLKVIFLGE